MAPSNTTSTIDSSHHIGGNLYLPDPEMRTNGERLARARELQPLLEQLNARDLSSESRNLISLKSSNIPNYQAVALGVDESPRWTMGDPPKYVERRPACLNCLSEGRPRGARFVPIDVTIPSIYKKRISTFEENFGSLEEDTKPKHSQLNLKVQKSLGHPRPFRAKAPAKLKSLEANISSKQERSLTAAEEK